MMTASRYLGIAKLLSQPHKQLRMTSTERGADSIHIRLIQPKDRDAVLDFLRIHYYLEEPLTAGSEPKQQDVADEEFNMSNIKHGTCLMAVRLNASDCDNSENVVGAVLAGPKDGAEAEHLFEEAARVGPTKWGHILQFLACVERDADVYTRYGVNKALHAHVLAVDGKVRGKAIGARLMQALMEVGRKRNFPLLTLDCTSVYSAMLCERLGMDCVHVVNYADYVDSCGKQVFCPPPPHECVKTFAIRL